MNGLDSVNDVDMDKVATWSDEPTKGAVKTMSEFHTAIARAHATGMNEIEATVGVLKNLTAGQYNEKKGLVIHQNVFVFEAGRKDEVKKRLGMKMEQKLFGHSTQEIRNIDRNGEAV